MDITIIGCLHGHYPKLPGGDLLIVTGDLAARDTAFEYYGFVDWVKKQPYHKIIVIAGNHDTFIQNNNLKLSHEFRQEDHCEYLCDSGTEFEGLKIWGTPWTSRFPGINPHCMAHTVENDGELIEKFDKIPKDTDILISHGPPWGVLDENTRKFCCGSVALRSALERVKPKLHCFSHIHERGGERILFKHQGPNTWCINCSIMDENYSPVHPIIRIEL